MISIISPAKSLDFNPISRELEYSIPVYRSEAKKLVNILKELSVSDIQSLMHISHDLSQLNYRRYRQFKLKHNEELCKAAVLAFNGGVYQGLNANDWNDDQLLMADERLRILSGLYGLLKPLDLIHPYRLEMGTSLQNPKGKNLYYFWGDTITKALNKQIKKTDSKYLINVASKEYFKAVNREAVKAKVIDINFKEDRGGELKFISFSAKKARGLMARYIIENEIYDLDGVKAFNYEGYYFREDHSTENEMLFVKDTL